MNPHQVTKTLDRLADVEYRLNDPDSDVKISEYFEALKAAGLRGKPRESGPLFHDLRKGILTLRDNTEDAEFVRKQKGYAELMGRVQTDNYLPPDFYEVRTTQGKVSAPYYLMSILGGDRDTTIPWKSRRKRSTQRERGRTRKKRRTDAKSRRGRGSNVPTRRRRNGVLRSYRRRRTVR